MIAKKCKEMKGEKGTSILSRHRRKDLKQTNKKKAKEAAIS